MPLNLKEPKEIQRNITARRRLLLLTKKEHEYATINLYNNSLEFLLQMQCLGECEMNYAA